jgi:hypothetical protein
MPATVGVKETDASATGRSGPVAIAPLPPSGSSGSFGNVASRSLRSSGECDRLSSVAICSLTDHLVSYRAAQQDR